jgi:hypothetical protein
MKKSKFVNFPMIAEIVSRYEGITIASEIINHSQQLAPWQSIFSANGGINTNQKWILDLFNFDLNCRDDNQLSHSHANSKTYIRTVLVYSTKNTSMFGEGSTSVSYAICHHLPK